MYAVVTRVKLLPGMTDEYAAMFRAMHPSLTEHETEWRSARLLADRDTDTAISIEIWHSAEAYRRHAASGPFQEMMHQLERCLDGPPHVTFTEVLAEFERDGGTAQGIAFGPG